MKKFFYIQKYALWQQNETEKKPDVKFIPSLLSRRLTTVEKTGIFLAHQLEPLPENCHIVFASRFGEWQQTIDLIQQFHMEGEMSPAGFSHSVHNAMPGMLSVLTKSTNTYTSIAAKEWTIENALIEAFCEPKPVVFIFAEEETPEFYRPQFSNPLTSHGVAFIISDKESASAQKISVDFEKNDVEPVLFSQLVDFLGAKESLTATQFVIRKV